MFYCGDLGKVYKEEPLISFTVVLVTLSIAKEPQMPLPLGNFSVCHAEDFSLQKAKHQRQLDSIFCGLHCPRGQELSVSLVTHFASCPLPSTFYLFWPSG